MKTLKLSNSVYASLVLRRDLLDSPSLDSAVHFLIRQTQDMPLAELVAINPTTYTPIYPEQRPALPLHSIKVGDDTYRQLNTLRKAHRVKTTDGLLQLYLYQVELQKDCPEKLAQQQHEKITRLQEEVAALTSALVEAQEHASTMTELYNDKLTQYHALEDQLG